MKSKANGVTQRSHRLKQAQVEGPNWVLLVGGALLSTLSIKLGCKLKEAFDTRRPSDTQNVLKGNGKSATGRRSKACHLQPNIYHFGQDEDNGYHSHSGRGGGRANINRIPASPLSNDADADLPLAAISVTQSAKDNVGVTWASSTECLELPQKPFCHSNSSDSLCASESGSDIFSKREVIQKLRQQLKRRDEMILEMQAQIAELQNSLSAQMAQSANLQSQLDCANKDLFDSEREIQRLRMAIACHCMADASSPKNLAASQNWHANVVNGHANGYANGFTDGVSCVELNSVFPDKGGDAEIVRILKREVGELKEVIEGKEYLLQSYKEQKAELCTRINELQLRLAPQVPNIL